MVETNSRDHGRVLGKGHGTEGLRAAGAGQETKGGSSVMMEAGRGGSIGSAVWM